MVTVGVCAYTRARVFLGLCWYGGGMQEVATRYRIEQLHSIPTISKIRHSSGGVVSSEMMRKHGKEVEGGGD